MVELGEGDPKRILLGHQFLVVLPTASRDKQNYSHREKGEAVLLARQHSRILSSSWPVLGTWQVTVP